MSSSTPNDPPPTSGSNTGINTGIGSSNNLSLHVMVLVHGIMGNSNELSYVKEALEKEFSAKTTTGHANERTTRKLIVHSAQANDGNTLDGIEMGGKRLADEINALLQHLISEHDKEGDDDVEEEDAEGQKRSNITVYFSMLGNSLGGLYARYALAHIDWRDKSIVPNLFVTTATPHLGVRDMTYWKVPKSLYPVGAWYMKQTGDDLFRYTDVLHRLCLDDTFLRPLATFSHRRAYANAFSTDAAVPTSTAAFLSDSSSTWHTQIDDDNNRRTLAETTTSSATTTTTTTQNDSNDESTILNIHSTYPTIRFQTQATFSKDAPAIAEMTNEKSTICDDDDDDHEVDRVPSYSKALDSLGWTKIFIDVRLHVPSLFQRERKPSELLQLAEENQTRYTSSELIDRLSLFDWNTLPFGHSFMVANAKNPIYSWFYSGGRPLVDRIAKEIIQTMLMEEPKE